MATSKKPNLTKPIFAKWIATDGQQTFLSVKVGWHNWHHYLPFKLWNELKINLAQGWPKQAKLFLKDGQI